MGYFTGYEPALQSADIPHPAAPKPPDTGGAELPFGHLGGRQLEILAYRLKSVSGARRGHKTALMQGTGERGRDVLVYDEEGHLIEVVQCKNLDARLTEPDLCEEILKLALHAYLEPEVLGRGPITYEIWSAGGFTEPAGVLLDTWPRSWTAEKLNPAFEKLSKQYAAFKELRWIDVATSVTSNFSQVVKVERRDGVDISVSVRENAEIYSSFFEGKVVMDRDQVAEEVKAAVSAGTQATLAMFGDQDAVHLLDRIRSFPENNRIVGTTGYVMGLSKELVSRFNQAEYADYARCAVQATFELTSVVQKACSRIAEEVVLELRRQLIVVNRDIFFVLRAVLLRSVLAKLNGLPMRVMAKQQPFLEQYKTMTLDERLEHQLDSSWDDYQSCIRAFDSNIHAIGSDQELRSRIAQAVLNDFSSKDDYLAKARDDIQRFQGEIEAAYLRFMALIPDDLLVITDTVTVFEKKMLFQRMFDGTNELSQLRGSDIIAD